MNKFFRSVGFSKYITKADLRRMARNHINCCKVINDTKIGDDGDMLMEARIYYGQKIGIIWYGTMDAEGVFRYDYAMPFVDGDVVTEEDNLGIERKKDADILVGLCDDVRIGISVIFQFQNTGEHFAYLREMGNEVNADDGNADDGNADFVHAENGDGNAVKNITGRNMIMFSGLSTGGTILLPIRHASGRRSREEKISRSELITAARNGDEKAIETLTLEEFDTYSGLSKRIKNEDLFTIVESSFMPYGIECDIYSIIGYIEHVESVKNNITGEQVYILSLNCNELRFNVAINAGDLVGEPSPGRRFKGNMWLQGRWIG